MNLLRSEEHVARYPWWGGRLAPDWRPRSRERNPAILDSHGLTGESWRLP